MSLKPDSSSSRARSKSRTRDRSRSHSHVRSHSSHMEIRLNSSHANDAAPRHMPAVSMPPTSNTYEREMSPAGGGYSTTGAYPNNLPYPTQNSMEMPYPTGLSDLDMGDFTDYPPEERAALRLAAARLKNDPYDEDLAYGTLPAPASGRQHSGSVSSQRPYGAPRVSSAEYRYTPRPVASSQPGPGTSYSRPDPYQYAARPENITYTSKANKAQKSDVPINYTRQPVNTSQHLQGPPSPRLSQSSASARSSNAHVVEVTPGVSRQSSLGLVPQMDRLTVGQQYDMSGGLPPPSPLLEPYHGTYQSISPMPSPMMYPRDSDLDDLPSLSQLSSSSASSKHNGSHSKHKRSKSSTSSSKHGRTDSTSQNAEKDYKKRVKLYDAEEDAKTINEALSHHRGPDPDPICDILPHLTHDQILELRNEYKKIAKVSGRGINIAKHIKMKLSGNFGKAAYVTALGRWESEGYWANFWYQSHGSRRELLIESLMGRSNAEIREIKYNFRDKRYGDDLLKCMEKELKADKFRVAILTALEEGKQEETEIYPREYVDKDASILRRCIVGREGGESAMLDIIIRRSDAHLREVLQTYERQYGANFAREALKKSNNLVGEVIAHILNGVINKPARDALLLRHAITDIKSHNKEDELRYELLISRLVRLHWDRPHLLRVKREYEYRYGKELEEDVDGAGKGDFREFLFELCQQ